MRETGRPEERRDLLKVAEELDPNPRLHAGLFNLSAPCLLGVPANGKTDPQAPVPGIGHQVGIVPFKSSSWPREPRLCHTDTVSKRMPLTPCTPHLPCQCAQTTMGTCSPCAGSKALLNRRHGKLHPLAIADWARRRHQPGLGQSASLLGFQRLQFSFPPAEAPGAILQARMGTGRIWEASTVAV